MYLEFQLLTFLTRQTENETCVNNVDPDELARDEPTQSDLNCLPFCFEFSTEDLFCISGYI